jgi:hypothetical protein
LVCSPVRGYGIGEFIQSRSLALDESLQVLILLCLGRDAQ